MAWTYATLYQALQDYCENDETTFLSNIPNIVRNAEDRILKSVQHPVFRKNSSGTMTDGNQYLAQPSDFLAPYSLSIIGGGFLIFKEVNFIRTAYPDYTDRGTPKHYAIYDSANFILGPTPNASSSVEIHYFYRPETIVTASTSWLGTNEERLLLYACLVECDVFHKGDADMMAKYQQNYEDSLAKFKLLAEGYNKTDSYRAA